MTRLVPEVDNRGIAFVPEYRHGRRGQGKMPHFARADERALIPPTVTRPQALGSADIRPIRHSTAMVDRERATASRGTRDFTEPSSSGR